VVRVRVERELRHREHAAADVPQRSVHAPGVVVEDAQAGDLVREQLGVTSVIGPTHAEEDGESGIDRAEGLAVDEDARAPDALDDGAHA
jgi:hypothetical protein